MTKSEEIVKVKEESSGFQKISSAVFYWLSSFLITVVNKRVLTSYRFPSFLFLSLGQLIACIVVLFAGKRLRVVSFPPYSNDLVKEIFPLPLIYLGNMVFGLGGTQALSLPMFAALRRLTILMTMFLEFYILKLRPTKAIQITVYGMVGGAMLAASDDLAFNLKGYTMIIITDILSASNTVLVKKKLSGTDCGTYGLMFYNSLVMALPVIAIAWLTGDIEAASKFDQWSNPSFVVQFVLSCIMGFILNYSQVVCTQHNSALTTMTVGCLKNVSITYIGMFIGGDYIFSWLNCIGLNISIFSSLVYTYVVFRTKKTPQPAVFREDDEEEEKLLESSEPESV
jgi:solute carrier family 35